MKALSIPTKSLLALCNRIRTLKQLSVRDRRLVVDTILKEIDLRERDVEHLLCVKHTKELRGYASHASIYRALSKARQYRVCCRDFFDRTEIEMMPPKGELSSHLGKKRLRVGRKAVS